jgi:plasmid stabilization system protein ParE
MKVRMSDAARSYLRKEAEYLRKHSRTAAKSLSRNMTAARKNLAAFGEIGFEKEGLPIPGMRRLIVGDYLLDYEVSERGIDIVSIRHGRQVPPNVPVDENFDFEGNPTRDSTPSRR